jgi:hypothetical protein
MLEALTDIGSCMKDNWQVFPIDSRGIPYLGYRVFSDHVLLKKPTKELMRKAADRISWGQEDSEHVKGAHDVNVVRSCEGF